MTVRGRVRAIPTWQLTLGAALLGLGFLIAAQLGSEGPRIRYTTQERTPLLETATGLQAQQDELKDQLLDLRAQIGGQVDERPGRRGEGPVAVPGVRTTSVSSKIALTRAASEASRTRTFAILASEIRRPARAIDRVRGSRRSGCGIVATSSWMPRR